MSTPTNTYALITGATKGIGLALTKLIAADNYNLFLISRTAHELTELKNHLNSLHPNLTIHTLAIDLSEDDAPKKIHEYTTKHDLSVSLLINNAGFGDFGPFDKSNWEKQSAMIHTNILSLTHLTRLYLPEMLKTGVGKILNLSSTAAFFPGPLMSVYYATKGFVQSFSEALSSELEHTHITVTALCPGPTNTNFEQSSNLTTSKLFSQKLSTPEQIADYGYNALKQGRIVAVPSLKQYFLIQLAKFLPRRLIRTIIKKLQSPK